MMKGASGSLLLEQRQKCSRDDRSTSDVNYRHSKITKGPSMTINDAAAEVLIKNQIPPVELEDDRHPRYLEHKEKIIKLHQAGAITQAQITAIVGIAPHLIDLAKSVAETAAKSQNAVLDAHLETAKQAISAQEKILEKAISEVTLAKISDNISSMNKSNNETQEKLNQSNNSLFEKLTLGVVGFTVGAVAGIFLSKK